LVVSQSRPPYDKARALPGDDETVASRPLMARIARCDTWVLPPRDAVSRRCLSRVHMERWLWAKARPSPEPDIAHVYAAPTIAGPEVIAALQAGATVTLVPGAMTGSP